MTDYEAVIGIETHVELYTASKMFCSCAVAFGAEPNTLICPTCLALPGALPVPNKEAIEGILKIGASLECELVEHSLFHRKNYFYPDLPKNYQISQFDVPLCIDGRLDVDVEGQPTVVGITRVHMEEDTGKSLHAGSTGRIQEASHSLLDFNRAGVPLVEIVTEPDITSPEQARAYATELQKLLRSLDVSDARLEEGSMRFDANVSVRPVGQEKLGTRAEVKNMNSLRSLQRATAYEIKRQIELVESGGTVIQETRHWNEENGTTTAMRSKEESEDYRYFQEPDLLPLHVDEAWRTRVFASLPELPGAKRQRYVDSGVDEGAAATLIADQSLADLFEAAVGAGAEPKAASIWVTGEVVAFVRREDTDLASTALTPEDLVVLGTMVSDGTVSSGAAKDVLRGVMAGDGRPMEVAESKDLLQISDAGFIETEVDAVLAAHPEELARMREGDMKPIGFLVGQVMQATKGKADPKQVSEVLRSRVAG